MDDEIPLGPAPTGWADEPLCRYMDDWRRNQLATFQTCQAAFRRLQTIDSLFLTIADNLDNTPQTAPALFFYRAHASYRTAVGLAMAGQVVEAYPILRNCLEQGLYAYFVFKQPTRYNVWATRHDSPASLRAVKDVFQIGDILNEYTSDHNDDGRIAHELYEQTIDWGAHPNTHGLMQTVTLEHTSDAMEVVTQYLYPGTLAHASAMKDTARIGVGVLIAFGHIFEPKYALFREG